MGTKPQICFNNIDEIYFYLTLRDIYTFQINNQFQSYFNFNLSTKNVLIIFFFNI